MRSLELSLISNQRMNALVNKMKTGELSMGNEFSQNDNLSNSQKAYKFFNNLNNGEIDPSAHDSSGIKQGTQVMG